MDLFGNEPSEFITDDEDDDDDIDDGGDEPAGYTGAPGLTHPRTMDICLGHEGIEKTLLDMLHGGRMPHSLIFAGQKGIGKATMAYRLARHILKNGTADPNQDSLFGDAPAKAASLNIAPDDPVFRRVASGGHADMMSVERAFDEAKNRFKSGVDVDEIRKIAPFLRMTASDGGWRVVIIDDADTMGRSAQNAILKILEEPPKNTILILVAHSTGALIPTIRSRARVMHFQPLEQGPIRDLLARQVHTLTNAQLDTLLQLAGGSIGKALHHIQENGLETLDQILAIFEHYPAWNWGNLHILAEDLGRAGREQGYKAFEELLQWTFAQLAMSKARGQSPQLPALHGFMRNSSLEQLLKICENLESHFNKVETANLDKRQGVLGAFSLIAA